MIDSAKWQRIAESIGAAHGFSSSELAKKAIEEIIGRNSLKALVDCYVNGEPYGELARGVLKYIHPQSAMDRCYEIYKTSKDYENRYFAIELLRAVADHRGEKWIREILNDPDEKIQALGASMLDQLLRCSLIDFEDEETQGLMALCKNHQNDSVREHYSEWKNL